MNNNDSQLVIRIIPIGLWACCLGSVGAGVMLVHLGTNISGVVVATLRSALWVSRLAGSKQANSLP